MTTKTDVDAERIASLPRWAQTHIAALTSKVGALEKSLATANGENTGNGSCRLQRGYGHDDVWLDDSYGIRWVMPPPEGDLAVNDRFFFDVKRASDGVSNGRPGGAHRLEVMASGPVSIMPLVSNILQLTLLPR